MHPILQSLDSNPIGL